jgi:hypothetical protein
MSFVDHLAEQKIAEAIARGELSGLPGEGAPLPEDDAALVPEELRLAYRVLRNAGFVPPEVATLRDIGDLEKHVQELPDGDSRARALRKLQILRSRLEASGRFLHVLERTSAGSGESYSEKLLDRLQGEDEAGGDNAKQPVQRSPRTVDPGGR